MTRRKCTCWEPKESLIQAHGASCCGGSEEQRGFGLCGLPGQVPFPRTMKRELQGIKGRVGVWAGVGKSHQEMVGETSMWVAQRV